MIASAPFSAFIRNGQVFTAPSVVGTSGQALTTNADGTTSWTTVSGAGSVNGILKANGVGVISQALSADIISTLGYTPVNTTAIGAALGVASLDSGGKVPTAQLPDAVLGALNYQGAWNATSNSPTLTSSIGTKGFFYTVSVAGSTNLNGITQWNIGDKAVYNGTVWEKIDGLANEVISVFGRTGVVGSCDLSSADASGILAAARHPALTGDVTTIAGALATTVALIAGTTVSGTTGSTNVVFSASPTLTGTITCAAIAPSGSIAFSVTAQTVGFTTGASVAFGTGLTFNAVSGTTANAFIYTSNNQSQSNGSTHEDFKCTATFNPTSGASPFVGMSLAYTINQTSTASGGYTALKVNVTETAVLGASKQLLDLQVGAVSKFAVDNAGNITTVASIVGAGSVQAGAGSFFKFNGRSGIGSSVDGKLTLFNAAQTAFTALLFGGVTTSFPSIKRNAAALNVRLADDSADATITAATQSAGDNTTNVATTAFVATSFAPLASPTFTGTPAAPTAAALTNTTQLATTAFVTAAVAVRAAVVRTLATWTVGDGSALITSGTKIDVACVPSAATITGWEIDCDVSSTVAVDIYKQAYSTTATPSVSITGSVQPAVTTAKSAKGTTLTGWTTALSADDQMVLNVSATGLANAKKLIVRLRGTTP